MTVFRQLRAAAVNVEACKTLIDGTICLSTFHPKTLNLMFSLLLHLRQDEDSELLSE